MITAKKSSVWLGFGLAITCFTSVVLQASLGFDDTMQDAFSLIVKKPEVSNSVLGSLSIALYYAHSLEKQFDLVIQDALLGRLLRCVWRLQNQGSKQENQDDLWMRFNGIIASLFELQKNSSDLDSKTLLELLVLQIGQLGN